MMNTTNMQPICGDDIHLEDALAFLRTVRKPDKAEIKVGSMAEFVGWCEHTFGPLVKAKPHEKPSPPLLMGVPVVVSDLLPPNRAALLVNDELQAIIELDGADRTALSEQERG